MKTFQVGYETESNQIARLTAHAIYYLAPSS